MLMILLYADDNLKEIVDETNLPNNLYELLNLYKTIKYRMRRTENQESEEKEKEKTKGREICKGGTFKGLFT